MRSSFIPTALLAVSALVNSGCSTARSTNTARTGTEQLLISNSIDQALNKVDFRPFHGQKIFLEEKYIDCVDKNYLVGSIRHRLLNNGAILVPAADQAEIILEARSGTIGTDNMETFFGMPAISVPGPMPIALPEVKIVSRNTQFGTAKIGLVAFDAKTREVLGAGGTTLARADDNNWFVFGVGPWKNGSLKMEVDQGVQPAPEPSRVPTQVAFRAPGTNAPTQTLPAHLVLDPSEEQQKFNLISAP